MSMYIYANMPIIFVFNFMQKCPSLEKYHCLKDEKPMKEVARQFCLISR